MLRVDPEAISPVIGIDSYTMPQPFFGPHPHAGMSAVSLMLPEADAGFVNRDSLGDHSLIRPGDLHWTQAGRGMMHEEVPAEPGKAARGLQIFVNLKREHKQADPAAFKVRHEDMPVVRVEGGSVRVVAGRFADQASPIAEDARWLTPVNMLDVTLEPGASVDIAVAAKDNAFFVVRSGSVWLDPADKSQLPDPLPSEQLAVIFKASDHAETARITAGQKPLRGVFFSGSPIREPMMPGGPFMGNSEQDILAYKRAFARGDMGHLERSF